MSKAKKIFEIETLCENLLKKHRSCSLLKLKVLYFASIYENLSVSMIIEKIGIQKSNFALMSNEMEAEGLLTICPAEIDRRCRVMHLTEKGKQALDTYLAEIDSAIGASSLEVDHALDVLIDYLNKKI